MLKVLAGFCMTLVLVIPLKAEGTRIWTFDDSGDSPTLQYGNPDADDIVILFACEPQARRMHVSEFVSSNALVPGNTARLRLINGAVSLDYSGQTIANETDGSANIEVWTSIDPKLFALLKSGTALTINVADKQEIIPLKGAASEVAALEKACFKHR